MPATSSGRCRATIPEHAGQGKLCGTTPLRGPRFPKKGKRRCDEINGVDCVVYGFGGNPGSSFELGDAVIAFALPSATAATAAKAKGK
jgi:hypothetical protein